MTMNIHQIELIQDMLNDGMTATEIAAETMEAEAFERDAYGSDDAAKANWTDAQIEFHDRLSLGRNDGGEWLGFM